MGRPDFRGTYPDAWPERSLQTKIDAGFRCVRCLHRGAQWVKAPNDPEMVRAALAREGSCTATARIDRVEGGAWIRSGILPCDAACRGHRADGKTRVLTVHHLDNNKTNLRWWNLAALCQVCHLQIQAKVAVRATYMLPHSDWFLPYVAGFYAMNVLGVDLSRDQVEARLVELLIAGQPHLAEHYLARLSEPRGEKHGHRIDRDGSGGST